MQYDADLNFNYFSPTKVVFGPGAVAELPMETAAFGKKAFLVTDKGIIETGLAQQVQKQLGDILVGIYDDVPQDSGMEVVDRGAEKALAAGAELIVSMGGGSVIDTAKGMCIVMKEGGSLRDFQGMQMLTRSQIPHIVIPTTSGTGSEVTSGAVVLDKEQGQKIIIFEYHNTPRVAILDPQLTASLPASLTASTGMDALTHAVEAFVSLQRNPISDAVALHAIRLIVQYLPIAVDDGSDLRARGQMQLAALMAGWAFSNAMLGLTHAMAHSLGAVNRVPHGLANGLLLAPVMQFNLEAVPGLMADIARVMGIETIEMTPVEAGQAAVDAVAELTRKIGLKQRLQDLGVKWESLRECAELSLSDGSIIYNPRLLMDVDEIMGVYQKVY